MHNNVGPGIWTDTDNVNTLVDGNVITHNTTEGILDEASYAAIIRNNTIKGNGYTGLGGLWNSQILLQDSSNVQVYANTVEVPQGGGNGIGLINYSRPSGAMGAHVTSNNLIHDNTVIYLSSTGQTGVVSEASIRGTAVGNEFNSNHYILQVGDASVSHWVWFDSVDWDGFRAGGQEALGTCCN